MNSIWFAYKEGEVRIKRKNGQIFVIRPETRQSSPLDVESVDLGISSDEIVSWIREGQERFG